MTRARKYLLIAVTIPAALAGAAIAPRVDVTRAVQFVPAADAAERGNFDHLAPEYDSATGTVIFEGVTYALRGTTTLDGDDDGSKETTFQLFTDGANRRIGRYTTKGTNWAWSVFRDYTDKKSISNFILVDTDGDGPARFDAIYEPTEAFELPPYLK